MTGSAVPSAVRTLVARCAIVLVLVFAGCDGRGAAPPDNLRLGEPFPSLTVTDLAGASMPLDTGRGKVTVLNVWATWCAPCRRELPSLQRLSDALGPERFAVVGLSVDEDVHVVREYLVDVNVTFPNFVDVGRRLADQVLGLTIYPNTFVLAADGTVLARFPGEQQWDDVRMVERIRSFGQADATMKDSGGNHP